MKIKNIFDNSLLGILMAGLIIPPFLFCGMARADFGSSAVHTIVVSGLGERSVEPNLLSLNVEIWSRGKTAKEAQALNAKENEKLQKVIANFKIKKEDIRTENFDTNPDYVWENNKNKIVGYRVVHTLKMTLRNVAQAGEFVDAISFSDEKTQYGVNINSITWDSDKKSEAEVLAIGEAVRDAKRKAEALAKASETKIKGIYKISYFSSPTGGGPIFGAEMMSADVSKRAKAAPQTALVEGDIKVKVNVTVEYELN